MSLLDTKPGLRSYIEPRPVPEEIQIYSIEIGTWKLVHLF